MSTSQAQAPDTKSLDPYHQVTDEFLQNPYPHYELLRTQAPIYKSPDANRWLISNYSDVNAILRDQRFSSERYAGVTVSASAGDGLDPVRRSQSNWLVMRDEPDHTRLRTLMTKAFTPNTVQNLRAEIEQIVESLLTDMTRNSSADLIADYAFLLPVTVIASMLGVPAEDHPMFSKWSKALTAASDVQAQKDRLQKASNATEELSEYFRTMVERRRSEPKDDLISALVAAEEQGSKLSTQEVLDNCIMLLFAGHETTVNLIGNGTLALLRHPEQLQKLQRHPEYIKTAVEELLRFDSPVQYTRRLLKEEVEYAGFCMKQFDSVVLILGSANRDPAQFVNADLLDITRTENKHVGLGAGIHFCLGAQLARVEAAIAISRLIERLPNLNLACEDYEYRDSAGFRGLKTLQVSF